MRNLTWLISLIALFALLTGCAKGQAASDGTSATVTKTLHCDNCGTIVTVEQASNMEESWIIYCGPCNEELFGDHPILGNS